MLTHENCSLPDPKMGHTERSIYFDFAPSPLAVIGTDGAIQDANAAFFELVWRTPGEAHPAHCKSFIHPDDLHSFLQGLRIIENSAGPTALCARCRLAEGSWRWTEWTCSPAPSGSILAAIRDVTTQRADSRRLAQLESQMAAATAEVWLLDREGLVVQTNEYLSTLLGLPESGMLGKRREDLKPGLDAPDERFAETLGVAKTGHPVWRSLERWGVEGDFRWASVDKVPLRGDDGEVSHIVVFAYEITSEIEAEMEFRRLNEELELRVAIRTDELAAANAALRTSEERTRAILANALDAVVTMDRNGVVTHWNKAAENILGWSSAEALGREFAELFLPEENRASHRTGLLEARETGTGALIGRLIETTALRKSGDTLPVELSITGVGNGSAVEFTAFIRDISERIDSQNRILDLNRQLEQRVEEAGAANRELEAFCYSVSHDLRTPLRSIDGFSLALIEDYDSVLDAVGRDYMGRVRSATQRMARLIDDLLNLSRVSRIEMTRHPADLSAIASEIGAELKQNHPGRICELKIQSGLEANVDPALIRIVLENLLNNAWKYTSKREKALIQFGATEQNGRLIFHVSDNGAGFDMAYAGKLFAPFQRLHRADEFEGSGVGLATVQRILHRHGGHAWAEAELGKGTTIYFTL
jgi:PAS domain S-box-containing protein